MWRVVVIALCCLAVGGFLVWYWEQMFGERAIQTLAQAARGPSSVAFNQYSERNGCDVRAVSGEFIGDTASRLRRSPLVGCRVVLETWAAFGGWPLRGWSLP